MNDALPGGLVREAFLTLASVGGPIFLSMLIVGLVLGILQSATQINDTSVSFLPRLASAMTVIWLMGGWIMDRLSAFLTHCITRMAGG